MEAFKDIGLNNLLSEAIFLDIRNKIIKVSNIMVEDLLAKNKKIKNNENHIRDYLVNYYLKDLNYRKEFDLEGYLFETEVKEIGKGYDLDKYGFLDVKIIIKEMSFSNPDAYFIIECKRLDGSKSLNEKYVTDGICRFVSKEAYYSTYFQKNYMMGFIVKEIDISKLIESINIEQEKISSLEVIIPLKEIEAEKLYRSSYFFNNSEVNLDHMFINVSKVVET